MKKVVKNLKLKKKLRGTIATDSTCRALGPESIHFQE